MIRIGDFVMSNNNKDQTIVDDDKRFGSRFGYIMVAAGAAVGLGNIWKFPYVTYGDGGGTFLIVYIIIAIFVGIPAVTAETAIGRRSRANAIDAYGNINKKWKFLGWINVICTTMIDFYYMIVSGYILKYVVAYIKGANFGANKEAYYTAFISDPVKPLIYSAIVIAVTCVILATGMTEKVESTCKIILPGLLVLLVICGIWALVVSPDAVKGLSYYLIPDFTKINFQTFADACMQVLFSVGIGWAIFITLGANVGDNHNLRSDSKMVVLCDSAIAILAGFVIIPAVVGSGSEMTSGPSLIFLAMTSIFEQLPGGDIIGIFFFAAILFAVLSTCFTVVEIPVKTLQEKLNISHTASCIMISIIIFVGGVFCSLSQGYGILSNIKFPWLDFSQGVAYYNIYDWIDTFTAYVLLPLGALLMAIFATRVWGYEGLNDELMKGGGKSITLYDKITMGILVPLLDIIAIIHAFGIDKALGWI